MGVFTSFYVPNAFTPNADGVNDFFYVYGSCISELRLIIYNTTNTKKIFESYARNIGWDGTFKGVAMPPGEYPFHIEATYYDGEEIISQGTVQLLR